MNRRAFIKSTSIVSAGLLGCPELFFEKNSPNSIPAWRGFNLTDFNTPDPEKRRRFTSAGQLQWMRDWGFDFIRLPISYPFYLKFDRSRNILKDEVDHINEEAIEKIDALVYEANRLGLHVSITLHRAPGYCINSGFHEPFNLWKDEEAVEAFVFHWNFWAKRYKNLSSKEISFDLLNEPALREDMNDQHSHSSAIPAILYHKVAAAAVAAIRKENPSHLIIADGNNVGNTPIPELKDLNIAQSCRGYFPHAISHYKAPWANKDPESLPLPVYPGKTGSQEFNRKSVEGYYQPWIALKNSGVGVHCGECGGWNKTPHPVFLTWFRDVLKILSSNGIGYALWEFEGDFGILNSGRKDVAYENWYGYNLDRKLLTLLQNPNA